ncbi:hypothetical protein Dsin_008737 [Dipteronia sinensis]|uniref:DUF659 domain-containing protein n=1 Tax=Dipteronia sinensis TaxID=43782 RepID=A0AAE0AQG6_9ROSI|nr:hypothetical protein Dsin_008737 [Dipteronia sinensis]
MTSLPDNSAAPNPTGNVNVSSGASNATSVPVGRKRKSNDVGWEFGILIDENNPDKVKCILCEQVFSGGVYRLKEHVANIQGNVAQCRKASIDMQLRCRQAIMDAKNKKKNKKKEEDELRVAVNIGCEEDLEEMEGLGPRKTSKLLGPMDKFANPINPNSSASGKSRNTMKQQSLNDTILKERTHVTQRYVAKWVYQAGIPFNAIDNDCFLQMVEAIGQFGPSFKPPSQWQLRELLLKEEFETTKEALKKQEQSWKVDGFSIMTDAWTDRKKRSIMNLCVNCKEGTTFLSSKYSSAEAHIGENILKYVLSAIEEVGPENVVQVVTDNASNNMAAAKMLKVKMPSIFWSSCATHTINLMLEGIGKQPKFKNTLEEAKSFTIFIYAHHTTLALMRTFTRKRDIVRPRVTRFASAFLTLQSLLEKKDKLRALFTSTDWEKCKWSKEC